MKYKTIDELDARVERIIDKTVKHYYTDWKNYDRPKYMVMKGSRDRDDKKLILIARECGTYLIRQCDVDNHDSWAETLWKYYHEQERSSFYFIDLDNLTVVKEKEAC